MKTKTDEIITVKGKTKKFINKIKCFNKNNLLFNTKFKDTDDFMKEFL